MKTIFTFLLAMCSTAVFSQEPVFAHLDDIDRQFVPLDTTVRTGVPANGLTYYVLQHDKPGIAQGSCEEFV